MKILGIDPGSVFCGYGVIETQPNLAIIEYGTIELKKKHDDFNLRLKEIYEKIFNVITRNKPEQAAIESTFYAKNAQSLIKLSQARAAAILAIINNNIDVSEYSAREIKKSVTGRGAASKEQVQFMVSSLFKTDISSKYFDTTDAIAIALCHSNKAKYGVSKAKSWSQYIKDNPKKIIKL